MLGTWYRGKPLVDAGHDEDDVASAVPLLEGLVEVPTSPHHNASDGAKSPGSPCGRRRCCDVALLPEGVVLGTAAVVVEQ